MRNTIGYRRSRFRANRDQLPRINRFSRESQGQNLALTVLYVPYSLDSADDLSRSIRSHRFGEPGLFFAPKLTGFYIYTLHNPVFILDSPIVPKIHICQICTVKRHLNLVRVTPTRKQVDQDAGHDARDQPHPPPPPHRPRGAGTSLQVVPKPLCKSQFLHQFVNLFLI